MTVRSWIRRWASELWPVALAASCFAAAMHPIAVPVWVAVSLVALVVMVARPVPLLLAIALLCASLATQAIEGRRPLPVRTFEGVVQLVSDPVLEHGSVTADVRISSGRLRMVAGRDATAALAEKGAGDLFMARGRIGNLSSGRQWRHLRGQLVVEQVVEPLRPTPLVSGVNALRATIVRGARVLPVQLRPVELGFVIGDDRGVSPVLRSDFDEAGLAHLMVVSGENLGFMLLLVQPVLRRFGLRRRFAVVVVILGLFASVTRFEPSVLRASAMAAVFAVSVVAGRPVSAMRVMSLGVAGVILLDPLIVHSLGFRLSVAATAGIVLLAVRIAAVLPFPRRVSLAIALPVAAQIGVAPIALTAFGSPSLAAVPANVLAAPAAAFVMMWGSTVGVIAGLVPLGVASLLMWPTRIALGWVCGVAELSADHRIATFAVPVAIGAVVAVCIRIRRHRSDRIVLLAILVVLILPLGSMLAAAPSRSAAGCFDAGRGRVCRSAGPPHLVVASVGADVDSFELLGALRAHGLSRVDLVVSTSSTEGAQVVLSQISERVAIGSVITPDQWCGDGPPTPMLRTFSTMNVSIRCDGDRLEVSLTEQSDQER